MESSSGNEMSEWNIWMNGPVCKGAGRYYSLYSLLTHNNYLNIATTPHSTHLAQHSFSNKEELLIYGELHLLQHKHTIKPAAPRESLWCKRK